MKILELSQTRIEPTGKEVAASSKLCLTMVNVKINCQVSRVVPFQNCYVHAEKYEQPGYRGKERGLSQYL